MSERARDIYREIMCLEREGIPAVLVTVASKEGHSPARLQSKMLVAGERQWGTVGGGTLELLARREALSVLADRAGRLVSYRLTTDMEIIEGEPTGMVCGGVVTLFYEYLGPAEQAVLFGAGHIGRELARLLPGLGYTVTVVDNRQALLEDLPDTVTGIEADPAEYALLHPIAEGGYAVISTHSHELDYRVLESVYRAGWPLAYLGMIASHVKREVLIAKLPAELAARADSRRLYTPCGLDIGGKSPAEIALSVAAEMQSLRYGRDGQRHMRQR